MSEPSPGPRERLRSALALLAPLTSRIPVRFRGKLTHFVLLVAVSVAASFVLSPGLSGQPVPELRSEDVGRPYRANSPAGFKATRDYEIVDSAMTEQRRQEARAAVQPVYDLNPGVADELKGSLHDAFASMRDAAHDAEEQVLTGDRHHKTADVAAAVAQHLKSRRRAFELRLFGRADAALEDEDFQALVTAQFSPSVESAAAALIDRAYVYAIGGSREELDREGAHGITLRRLSDGMEQIRAPIGPDVLDVREVQAELDRFSSIPGNLLPDAPVVLRRAVLRLSKRLVRPDLTINTAETDARRRRAAEAVKDAVIQIKKGQKVIGDGELITEAHLIIVQGMRAQLHQLDMVQLQFGGAGLVALLIGACYVFHRAAFRRFRPTRKDGLLLGALLLSMLCMIRISVSVADAVHDRYASIPLEALYAAIPVAAGAMLVRFILIESMSLFFALIMSCLAGVMLGNSLAFGIYTLVGSMVAAEQITRAKERAGIFRAGVVTGVVNVALMLCLELAEGKGLSGESWITCGFALAGTSLGVPVLVMALTPLIEMAFGYASDIKLLELANLNHPALKELIVQAPGTYHHSIIVGTLVENAAEAIGANPLLARACAYYHDIGKGRNPLYFGENQKAENRHDALAPSMSAVIIKRHVTEGMEMARQYRLPKLVADAIPQHHGTRVVGYFYHRALKEQEGKENPQPLDENVFRYPGPKPQFREAALVMIADAVEASSRAMQEPTTPKLQAQVQKIINMIFAEGQLDECELSLKDLNLIAQSFLHTLEGIYHARPQYPPGALVAPKTSSEPPRPALTVAKPPDAAAGKRTAGG